MVVVVAEVEVVVVETVEEVVAGEVVDFNVQL